MSFDGTKIVYLEGKNICPGGALLHDNGTAIKDGIWFIMIQSPTCPHCVTAKPAFVEASKRAPQGVMFATAYASSADPKHASSFEAAKKLSAVMNSTSIPLFGIYNAKTQIIHKYEGQRTPQAFLDVIATVQQGS